MDEQDSWNWIWIHPGNVDLSMIDEVMQVSDRARGSL